ncbi:hypothetical protein GGR53DRAFT_207104 [Hypoxylon sp. FL1150]|nr:hypothetical protein GGR53DRAFT_207104 [Hypoxylon sp. FL1150]
MFSTTHCRNDQHLMRKPDPQDNLRQQIRATYPPPDLQDWSLLLPHPLETTVPGRQVLFKHQRVLIAAPTPTPSEDFANTRDRAVALNSTPDDRMLAMTIQRCKEGWERFKQRVTPPGFRHAWVLFLAIVMAALALTIICFVGVAREVQDHDDETDASTSSSVDVGIIDAMEATLSSGLIPTLAVSSTASERPEQEDDLGVTAELSVYHELVTLTTEATVYVSTIWITVTVDTASLRTSVSATETPDTTALGTMTSSTTIPVSPSSVSSTTVSSASISTWASVTSSVVSSVPYATTDMTASDLKYCPYSERPHVWTPCTSSPSDNTAGLALTTTDVSSDASSILDNPFSVVFRVLSSVWRYIFSLCFGVSYTEECPCCQDRDALRTALELVEVQREMLESQEALVRGHRDWVAAAMELVGAVRDLQVPGLSAMGAIGRNDHEPTRD